MEVVRKRNRKQKVRVAVLKLHDGCLLPSDALRVYGDYKILINQGSTVHLFGNEAHLAHPWHHSDLTLPSQDSERRFAQLRMLQTVSAHDLAVHPA